jgi:YesN/AraC family two-component response regulator
LPISRKAEAVSLAIETQSYTDIINRPVIEDDLTKKDKTSILIIEDNDSLRHILALQLQQYNVYVAKDGEKGIEKAIECIPDIIISDVMMPKKSGYEVCEALKLDRRTSHIPIVLVTAKADQESKLEGLRAKADAYLYKPYDVEELKLVIKNFIESRVKMQALYKIFNKKSPSTDRPQEDQFILEFRKLLFHNIKEDFGIQDLCQHLKISRAQLHNKLKALTGLSTSNYILLIRLQKASELLKSTSLNISEIAYEVGLKDANYFSRKFKKEFGMPPSEWRGKPIDA